ncbi:hypothetical protein Plhal703r1_c04g0022271 [Plasmopara halstedii]
MCGSKVFRSYIADQTEIFRQNDVKQSSDPDGLTPCGGLNVEGKDTLRGVPKMQRMTVTRLTSRSEISMVRQLVRLAAGSRTESHFQRELNPQEPKMPVKCITLRKLPAGMTINGFVKCGFCTAAFTTKQNATNYDIDAFTFIAVHLFAGNDEGEVG